MALSETPNELSIFYRGIPPYTGSCQAILPSVYFWWKLVLVFLEMARVPGKTGLALYPNASGERWHPRERRARPTFVNPALFFWLVRWSERQYIEEATCPPRGAGACRHDSQKRRERLAGDKAPGQP